MSPPVDNVDEKGRHSEERERIRKPERKKEAGKPICVFGENQNT